MFSPGASRIGCGAGSFQGHAAILRPPHPNPPPKGLATRHFRSAPFGVRELAPAFWPRSLLRARQTRPAEQAPRSKAGASSRTPKGRDALRTSSGKVSGRQPEREGGARRRRISILLAPAPPCGLTDRHFFLRQPISSHPILLPSPPGRGAGGEGRRMTSEPENKARSTVARPATTLTPALSRGKRRSESAPDENRKSLGRSAPCGGGLAWGGGPVVRARTFEQPWDAVGAPLEFGEDRERRHSFPRGTRERAESPLQNREGHPDAVPRSGAGRDSPAIAPKRRLRTGLGSRYYPDGPRRTGRVCVRLASSFTGRIRMAWVAGLGSCSGRSRCWV